MSRPKPQKIKIKIENKIQEPLEMLFKDAAKIYFNRLKTENKLERIMHQKTDYKITVTDIENKRKYTTKPWTRAEDLKLQRMLSMHKYTYDEISKELRRTNGAIQRRICGLEIKERPIKADNHIRWTEKELYGLGEMLKEGCSYEKMSEVLGKSSKAIRGRIYSMYLTENLDRAREIIGDGNFGDNRPDRKIKQWNVMNTEERIEVRDLIIRLTAILKYEFKLEINQTEWGEFFQKDTCQNFCGECLNTSGCDECFDYKRVEPQICKM